MSSVVEPDLGRGRPTGSEARLRELYVRASRGGAGLAVLSGGATAIVVYFAGAFASSSQGVRGLLALAPILWVILKEWLSRHTVVRPSRLERKALAVSTLVVAVSCLMVLLFALRVLWGREVPWPVWASLGFTVALPIIVWRHLHWVDELLLCTFLMYQAVTMLARGPYPIGDRIHIPIIGALAVWVGARQRLDWRRLGRQIEIGAASDRRGDA